MNRTARVYVCKTTGCRYFLTPGPYGLWGAIRNVNRVVLVACCIINTFAPGHWEKHLADLNGCNKILLGPTDIKNLFIIGYYPFILCIIGYCPFILYNIRQSRGAANRQRRFSTFTGWLIWCRWHWNFIIFDNWMWKVRFSRYLWNALLIFIW